MRGYKKFVVNALLSFLVICAAETLREITSVDTPFLNRLLDMVAFLVFFCMIVIWGVSIRQRVMRNNLRRLLTAAALSMVFWLLVRTARYFFVLPDVSLSRFLWYVYYIPMILLPLLGFYVALCIGKPEDRRPAAPWYLFFVAALGLIVLVLTNDVHAFVFAPLQEASGTALISRNEGNSYAYGWGYFLIAAWIILLELASIVLILYKGRENLSRRTRLMPLTVFALAVLYWLGYWRFPARSGVGFIELTVGISWFSVMIWESCIQIGLIPVNTRYFDFFHHATIHMQITDSAGAVVLTSADAAPLSRETFETLKKNGAFSPDPDTDLHLSPINCGYSVWEEDVYSLREMIEEQRLNAEELREGNTIAEKDYLAKRRRERIREKTRLYTVISNALQGDFDRLRSMVDALDAAVDPAFRRSMLARINLEGVFLKRAGNAIMMAEGNERITGEETAFCFAELRENMRLCGPEFRYDVRLSAPLSLEEALAVYTALREISVPLLDRASAFYALLSDADGAPRFSLTAYFDASAYGAIPRGLFADAAEADPPVFDDEERTLRFFPTLRKEGVV